MFNNSAKIMFFFILMAGTLITVPFNTWLGVWMGLEINLLSFIPLMNDNNNLMSTEASLKYFLTQALASAILLFAMILGYLKNSLPLQNSVNYINLIILASLLLKSGSAPFHFWFPNVMEGLTWTNGLILMTWQKIAPLMLISYVINNNFMTLVIITSVIVGSIGGLNQTSLRKLMAFSSINHLGWMLAAMKSSGSLWLTYFVFYSFLSFTIVTMFNNLNISHINQLFSYFFNSKTIKFTLLLNLLSLGGLPPFLGFMPKWLVSQVLVESQQYYILVVLLVTTLITLFFYLRLGMSAFMLSYNEPNWNTAMKTPTNSMNMMMATSFMSTFGLILISLFYYIL